ncbi:hypothetical protein [Williamsia herbipolensis]|uniref:hypothetical protein n=1 Tax=Williamsia herbipolensis TaxID=1603258 RepID=UPI00123778CE|nr:hypothetical protein [Williamsia herbipolensis]
MTDQLPKHLERARRGKRGGSRLRRETQPPHLRVMCVGDKTEFLPALGHDGATDLRELFWIGHPAEPRRIPVTVSAAQTPSDHEYRISPGDGDREASVVENMAGKVCVSAIPERRWLRSSWTINTPDRSSAYTFTERRRDGLWRRSVAPFTKLRDPAWEMIGLVVLLLFSPAMLKPPLRMRITDRDDNQIGLLTFCSTGNRPREDFCLYLYDTPYPLREDTLAMAALAIVQRMK